MQVPVGYVVAVVTALAGAVDGLDPTCKYIVGGLTLAVLGMAGYIVKQHLAERAILRDWIRSMQESKSLLDLVGEVDKNRPTGGT